MYKVNLFYIVRIIRSVISETKPAKLLQLGHPHKMFHFLSPDWPIFFFGKVKKEIRITCKEASLLVYKHTILSY